jgi:hypothetical protein
VSFETAVGKVAVMDPFDKVADLSKKLFQRKTREVHA